VTPENDIKEPIVKGCAGSICTLASFDCSDEKKGKCMDYTDGDTSMIKDGKYERCFCKGELCNGVSTLSALSFSVIILVAMIVMQ